MTGPDRARRAPDVPPGPWTERFAVRVSKEYFHFCSAHFLISPDGSREALHGHDYRVSVRVAGPLDEGGVVLDFLRLKPIVKELCDAIDHCVLLPADNAVGCRARLERLLAYMARHPFDPAGIRYDAAKGTVRYRAGRRHAVRKTAFIEVDALDFIAMLATHIPHARRHQVRYYGAAHPAVRQRLGLGGLPVDLDMPAVTAARGRRSWGRLIWRIYGLDPMICPKCGGPREILAVIFDPSSIARILRHLDLPTDLPVQRPARSPPSPPAEQRGARSPLPPANEDGGDDLFIDPDYSEWDGIDETFETGTGVDACASRQEEGQPPPVDQPPSSLSLLDLMKRHSGALCWADSLLEEQTPKT